MRGLFTWVRTSVPGLVKCWDNGAFAFRKVLDDGSTANALIKALAPKAATAIPFSPAAASAELIQFMRADPAKALATISKVQELVQQRQRLKDGEEGRILHGDMPGKYAGHASLQSFAELRKFAFSGTAVDMIAAAVASFPTGPQYFPELKPGLLVKLGRDTIENVALYEMSLPDGSTLALMCNVTKNDVGTGHSLVGSYTVITHLDASKKVVVAQGLHLGKSEAPFHIDAIIDLINNKDGGMIWATAFRNVTKLDEYKHELLRALGPEAEKRLLSSAVTAEYLRLLSSNGATSLLYENQAFISLATSFASDVMRALNRSTGQKIAVFDVDPERAPAESSAIDWAIEHEKASSIFWEK